MRFPKPFKKLFENIKISCEKTGNISSTRLTSYIILSMIVLFCLSFLIMGICKVVIANELIIVFMALLTHQLTLLGINKHNETKQKIAETKKQEVEL